MCFLTNLKIRANQNTKVIQNQLYIDFKNRDSLTLGLTLGPKTVQFGLDLRDQSKANRSENSLFGLDLRDQSKANRSENSPFGLDLRYQSKFHL